MLLMLGRTAPRRPAPDGAGAKHEPAANDEVVEYQRLSEPDSPTSGE
jgi:hypothetical protein